VKIGFSIGLQDKVKERFKKSTGYRKHPSKVAIFRLRRRLIQINNGK
jgi:hypothetical protein